MKSKPTPPKALLLDFFGTLVSVSPVEKEQAHQDSYSLLCSFGATVTYDQYLDLIREAFTALKLAYHSKNREFSMSDVADRIFSLTLTTNPSPAGADQFVEDYLREWNMEVGYPPGIGDLIASLAGNYRLAIVSNTHSATLVPNHLLAMGISHHFEQVVTSISVGWQKPHPRIYEIALERLGLSPQDALFVGDSLVYDYEGPRIAGMRAVLVSPKTDSGVQWPNRVDSIFDIPMALSEL